MDVKHINASCILTLQYYSKILATDPSFDRPASNIIASNIIIQEKGNNQKTIEPETRSMIFCHANNGSIAKILCLILNS